MVRGPGPLIVNFLYLINNLVSDFVTQLASQPSDQPASQLFKNSHLGPQLIPAEGPKYRNPPLC